MTSDILIVDAPAAPSIPAVSWGAILAGAVVAAGASLILLAVGAGMGFAALSPWQGRGATAVAVTAMTGVWLVVIQWAASLLGGYMTGRLRTRWHGTHTHEVFFRDTAHGLVMWAVSTVLVAALVTAAGLGAVKAAAGAADGPMAYEIDTLLRSNSATDSTGAANLRDQVAHILTRDAAKGAVSDADKTYLRDLIAARVGITPADAQARVDAAVTATRQAADTARKTASATGFFTALSMLIGAFIASVAAALGGKLRDEHP
jgi:hypothetical protein